MSAATGTVRMARHGPSDGPSTGPCNGPCNDPLKKVWHGFVARVFNGKPAMRSVEDRCHTQPLCFSTGCKGEVGTS